MVEDHEILLKYVILESFKNVADNTKNLYLLVIIISDDTKI